MRVIWPIAKALLLLALALGAIVAFRTWRLTSQQVPPGTPAAITIDADAAARRLAGAVRFPTISWSEATNRDTAAFLGLHDYLRAEFPRTHATLTRDVIADYSLLYTWPGTRADLRPIILLAHLDVVPADVGPNAVWTHPPFSGTIALGHVWGRGTIDDKGGVLGLLEAVEALIAAGFTPAHPIYLAFAHNEEGAGDASGAAAIARVLAARGVRNAWLLDEGGLIYDRVPGVQKPVAFVGISEKTFVNVELVATSAGGHASMPPPVTAVGRLARAVDRVERHPMPARLDGPTRAMLTRLAPDMTWVLRTAIANLWLLKPLVLRQFAATPQANATIRTTIAPTQLEGSPKVNALATHARAMLNARLLPGDTKAGLESHLRAVVDDPDIAITLTGPDHTTPSSPIDTHEFAGLERAIRSVYPDVLVSPFLTIASTDSREYGAVASERYRFLPIYQAGAVETIHGVNERVAIETHVRAIRTYATIVIELTK